MKAISIDMGNEQSRRFSGPSLAATGRPLREMQCLRIIVRRHQAAPVLRK